LTGKAKRSAKKARSLTRWFIDGTVRVAAPAVICAYCNGEGRANLNRDISCSVCKGKGVVTIECKEIQNCTACKGTGKECNSGLPCLTCKGKGVVTKQITGAVLWK